MTKQEVIDVLRVVIDTLSDTTSKDEPKQEQGANAGLMLPAAVGSVVTSNNPVPSILQEQQREIESLKQQLSVLHAQQAGVPNALSFNPIQIKGTM